MKLCGRCGVSLVGRHPRAKYCLRCTTQRTRGPATPRTESLADKQAATRARTAEAKAKTERGREVHQVAELAAALALYADARSAARFAGLDVADSELEALAARARREHSGIVEGDPSELGRRLMAALHLCASSAIQHRDQIAPRDLPHVMRALAQVHDIMVGAQAPRWSSVEVVVVGADGAPIKMDDG